MNDDQASAKCLNIRKYPNRRYYDATRSQHITLEQIHAAIRDGYEVRVTDSKTGEDITGKILAQIILELDPPKLGIFPAPLLHRLIRANVQLVTDFIEKYFNQALAAFMDSQRQFESYLRETMRLGPVAGPMTDWMRMMTGPFVPPFEPGHARSTRDAQPTSQASASTGQQTDLRAVVDDLRKQVATLQKRLGRGKR